MTFDVILIEIKYLHSKNISIHIKCKIHSKMNVLGIIFLNSCKDRRKGALDVKTEVFERCRRTYILNNYKIILLCNNDNNLQCSQ